MSDTVGDLRHGKSDEEIAQIALVQRATQAAMSAVLDYIQTTTHPTGVEAHLIIDEVLATHDCLSPQGHIVAGGIESAEPHEAGSGPLLPGTPIVIDIFPRSNASGWYADMSRTVCIGMPPGELLQMYDAVLSAQTLAISLLRPGAVGGDIQLAVEAHFATLGFQTRGEGKEFTFAQGFVHGVGHGVGQEVHEAPRIGRGSTDVLLVGDVVTIEPGLYYPHIGGVRLEDMLVITETGCTNLTHFPKELVL